VSKTTYVVMRLDGAATDRLPAAWVYLGQREAGSPELACKAQALEDGTGEYVALAASAWRPETYTVETRKTVVVGA
jgi:hypothetical protein